MPPFTSASLLTAWTASPFGLLLVAIVLLPYVWWLLRARAAGVRWPGWRVALYLVGGVGTLAYAVCGPLEVYRTQLFWVAALQVGIVTSVTPVGLALGDPVRLARAGSGDDHLLGRVLRGRVARLLMFPAVSSVLAMGSLMLLFFTPYFQASTTSTLVADLLEVHLLVVGLLFVVPILVDDLLPPWATPGVRALLAIGDGLLDAVPGLFVLTAPSLLAPDFPGYRLAAPADLSPIFDQQLGGGTLIAVAEAVGLPIIGVVFVNWMRSDEREARAIDAQLDAQLDAQPDAPPDAPLEIRHHPEPDPQPDPHLDPHPDRADGPLTSPSPAEPDPSAQQRPVLWWENDPRFEGRFPRRGSEGPPPR
ncbi:cytochrome c oxidase assembly protein [Lapillicoccus sp.]|uniref:cytochrome c oxidase assembly protein n=1 Tax=Lapillicoccus sp. TaxID=1909287 RepID=UPI0025D24C24|nr:cytochrome c oxidase assembly protein [Lapillicoccus sp.]